ncbi:hypothetical protein WH47_01198 [Habropoda laboriosa]|uniref:Uncharacterized protein n=1 Tax=Habropoda laboriosa TaxID=597456 RepID=A0A0L7QZA2_9HYME|nr:hypothetical protein WH47_01198 [Habropoda laboriosa]
MSIRVSGVYLVPSPAANEPGNEKPSNLSVENNLHQQHHHHHAAKTVTIVAGPQRSNSLDYLNFEEKRQIIASSLSLSDFLAHGPAAAAAAAKEVAANTVIGEFLRILLISSKGEDFFLRIQARMLNDFSEVVSI